MSSFVTVFVVFSAVLTMGCVVASRLLARSPLGAGAGAAVP
jgi:hypothetical protein